MRNSLVLSPSFLLLAITLLVVAGSNEVISSPFLPSSSAHYLSARGGGGAFFGGKPSRPPASNVFEQVAAGVSEKCRKALDTGVPTQLSYGFIAGYCSGIALKRVGQTAATVLGIGFVTLQTLSYYGYIEISHEKFKATVESVLGEVEDGQSIFKQSTDKLIGVLTYNMPSGAAFVGGFLGGLRS